MISKISKTTEITEVTEITDPIASPMPKPRAWLSRFVGAGVLVSWLGVGACGPGLEPPFAGGASDEAAAPAADGDVPRDAATSEAGSAAPPATQGTGTLADAGVADDEDAGTASEQ